MKKISKLFSITCLSILLGIMTIVPAIADEEKPSYSIEEKSVHLNIGVKEKKMIETISKIEKEIEFNSSGFIQLKSSDEYLISNYELHFNEIKEIRNAITEVNKGILTSNRVQPKAYIKDWSIYLTPEDQYAIISAYINLGPAAVATTLAFLLSAVPGAGTVIGAVIGYVGAGALIKAMMDTAANNKTIKIGLGGVSTVPWV